MILVVDVGNSNICFGVYEDNKLLCVFRLESSTSRTEDELASLIISCLNNYNINYLNIKGMIIASVILSLNQVFEKLAQTYFKTKPLFVGPSLKSGIAIKIEQPKTLGADILVGHVGAKAKYGNNCMIIDIGTATTMTILNNKDEYIGGLVYPGIKASANALATETSLLPIIDIEIPKQVICKETIMAMQAGLMYGYACMLDGMIDKIETEYGHKLKIILTGGLAYMVLELLNHEVILDENLVLDGLNILYHKNKKEHF
ncbi:MAG: type III pantothenate kinase [Bacilli bacterium]|jgi:type III pantothenate kinase|nr:type III pantothenate kinase [Bacilli bacterium]